MAAVLVIWAMDIQKNFSIRRIILNILASGWVLTGLTELVINLATKKLLSFYDLEWNVNIDKDLLTLFSIVLELHPPNLSDCPNLHYRCQIFLINYQWLLTHECEGNQWVIEKLFIKIALNFFVSFLFIVFLQPHSFLTWKFSCYLQNSNSFDYLCLSN